MELGDGLIDRDLVVTTRANSTLLKFLRYSREVVTYVIPIMKNGYQPRITRRGVELTEFLKAL
jgi:hypothetical protein